MWNSLKQTLPNAPITNACTHHQIHEPFTCFDIKWNETVIAFNSFARIVLCTLLMLFIWIGEHFLWIQTAVLVVFKPCQCSQSTLSFYCFCIKRKTLIEFLLDKKNTFCLTAVTWLQPRRDNNMNCVHVCYQLMLCTCIGARARSRNSISLIEILSILLWRFGMTIAMEWITTPFEKNRRALW